MKTFSLNPLGRRLGLVAATAVALQACAPGQDVPAPSTTIDVTTYLAVGDSYTAGTSGGGLSRFGQEYSFPNLMAQQLRSANTFVTFTQPLFEENMGSDQLSFVNYDAKGYPIAGEVQGSAVRNTVTITPGACAPTDQIRLLRRSATSSVLPQNLGVPGLGISQVEVAGLGNEARAVPGGVFNPFFERILPANDNRTYLRAVTEAAGKATFFTFFQGLDDVMPYVRNGGQCGTAPNTALTNLMRANAKKVLDVLTADGRRGIIARLPAITTLPLLRQGRGLALQARLQAQFNDDKLLYIQDPFNSSTSQPITDNDYVLAPVLPRIGELTSVQVGGTTLMLPYGRDARNPLRDADVLDGTDEVSRVNGVINSYNNELERLASRVYKLPAIDGTTKQSTLDLNVVLFNQVAESIAIGGVVYTPEPFRGNVFSLDYYTLTPRGNGLLANAFITAFNKAYRANIPGVSVNNLPTIVR